MWIETTNRQVVNLDEIAKISLGYCSCRDADLYLTAFLKTGKTIELECAKSSDKMCYTVNGKDLSAEERIRFVFENIKKLINPTPVDQIPLKQDGELKQAVLKLMSLLEKEDFGEEITDAMASIRFLCSEDNQ